MEEWKEYDRGAAICSFCEEQVIVVFKRRDLSYPAKNTIINNILVGICTQCDHIISIPQQSVEKIKND